METLGFINFFGYKINNKFVNNNIFNEAEKRYKFSGTL